jgi:hypothetical protein
MKRMGEIAERLTLAIATASNDDMSEPGSVARARHNARLDAMIDARDALSGSPTLPSREEIAKVMYHFELRTTAWENLIPPYKNQYLKQAARILSLFTAPQPLAKPMPLDTVEGER